MLVDVHKPRWPLLFANDGFQDLTGLEVDQQAGSFFWDEFSLLDRDGSISKVQFALQRANHSNPRAWPKP